MTGGSFYIFKIFSRNSLFLGNLFFNITANLNGGSFYIA